MSRHQNAGQYYNTRSPKRANKSFESITNFKYLGMTVTYAVTKTLRADEMQPRIVSRCWPL
jgi:hypothetical protein